MIPPSVIPVKRRFHRKRKRATQTVTPPAALSLTASDIDGDRAFVWMQFDRAVDISSIDVTQFQVGDIGTSNLYQGAGSATLTDPQTVRVPLVAIGPFSELEIELTATANTNIVAVDDGGTWAGTGGLNLPFP